MMADARVRALHMWALHVWALHVGVTRGCGRYMWGSASTELSVNSRAGGGFAASSSDGGLALRFPAVCEQYEDQRESVCGVI
jgi:hypothetical protein